MGNRIKETLRTTRKVTTLFSFRQGCESYKEQAWNIDFKTINAYLNANLREVAEALSDPCNFGQMTTIFKTSHAKSN